MVDEEGNGSWEAGATVCYPGAVFPHALLILHRKVDL